LPQERPQRVHRERPQPGGGQLQRQREAVEAGADLDHGLPVRLGEGEARVGGACPVDEQRDRIGPRQVRQWQRRTGCGDRQWRDGQQLLAGDPQRGATGGEDLQCRAGGEEGGDAGGGLDHLLDVVEEKQELTGLERRRHRRGQWPVSAFAHAERLGDRRRHQRRVADGGEVDEDGAVGEGRGDVVGDRQGEAGFADPAGAGQGQQGDGLLQQEGAGSSQLAFPAHQGGAHEGQAGQRLGRERRDGHGGGLRRDGGSACEKGSTRPRRRKNGPIHDPPESTPSRRSSRTPHGFTTPLDINVP
jgi:hypothetical protein